MNVIGLDLSTKTGVVCLSDDLSFYFADELNTKLTGFARLSWFRERILKLLKTYPPELVVIEGYSFSGKFTNSFQYEIGSIIRMALYDAKIPWVDIPPKSLKSAISSSGGKASKGMMLLEVFKRWGFSAPTDNVADAYGLAKIGQYILGIEKFNKANAATIEKIESVKAYRLSSKIAIAI